MDFLCGLKCYKLGDKMCNFYGTLTLKLRLQISMLVTDSSRNYCKKWQGEKFIANGKKPVNVFAMGIHLM